MVFCVRMEQQGCGAGRVECLVREVQAAGRNWVEARVDGLVWEEEREVDCEGEDEGEAGKGKMSRWERHRNSSPPHVHFLFLLLSFIYSFICFLFFFLTFYVAASCHCFYIFIYILIYLRQSAAWVALVLQLFPLSGLLRLAFLAPIHPLHTRG